MTFLQHPRRTGLCFPAAVISFALVFGLVGLPTAAFGTEPEDRIEQKLDDAREGYDMLDFEGAVLTIQDGLELAETEGIRSRDVAELHLFLGLIRHADGDDDLAEDAFVDAIETYPDITVDSVYMTPRVEELFERAEHRADPPPFEEPDDDPPVDDDPDPRIDDTPPEEEVDPLSHDPISRADAGDPVVVEAEIPADLPVFRVHLHHRRYGEDDFAELEMEPTDATGFEVELHGEEVRTSQIEYFITAIDRTGEVVAESGRTTNPHRMSVIGDVGDRDDPPDEPPAEAPEAPEDPDPTGFYATLFTGTDVGFLPGGTSPTANQDRSVSPGLSPAFAHTLLDLGWRLTEHNSLGMYFRWQFIPGQDFDHIRDQQGHPDHIAEDAAFWEHRDECFGLGIPGDCMLGLRYQQILASDIPQIYSSVGLGVGRVRNWLHIKQATDEDDPDPACEGRDIHDDPEIGQYCELRDTVRTGWAHIGVGGGMYLPLMDNLDFVADSYLMVLVPDTSVNLDVNVGLRFRL